MYRQHFIGTKIILVQAPEIEHRLNEFIGSTILAGYFDRLELIEKYDGTGIDFSAIIKLRAFMTPRNYISGVQITYLREDGVRIII